MKIRTKIRAGYDRCGGTSRCGGSDRCGGSTRCSGGGGGYYLDTDI